MSRPTLLDALGNAPHDHQHLRHPQTGNPFFPWWHAARFRCDVCLAVMFEGGDLALAFTQALPYRLQYEFDRTWWRTAYLASLRFVDDPADRDWMRGQLAAATRRGRYLDGAASMTCTTPADAPA